tara:strand:+ start:304 stop:1047 length:744 start_codon:yes stop_codon:yes gene_type:complete
MGFNDAEKLQTKDLYSKFLQYKISKEDLIILSEYNKLKKNELSFNEQGAYERDYIIPITKKYGMNMFSRTVFEQAIKKSPQITNENFDFFIKCNETVLDNTNSKKNKSSNITKKQAKSSKKSNSKSNSSNKKTWIYAILIVGGYFLWPSGCGGPSACDCAYPYKSDYNPRNNEYSAEETLNSSDPWGVVAQDIDEWVEFGRTCIEEYGSDEDNFTHEYQKAWNKKVLSIDEMRGWGNAMKNAKKECD